jgi:hypothetical protein
MSRPNRLLTASLSATIAFWAMSMAGDARAATCIGSCGHNSGTPDGVVFPPSSNLSEYDWVSTNGGIEGLGRIEGFDGLATNGSELLSDIFFAAAGQIVSFDFNYITSDGAEFADYGFAQLIDTASSQVYQLFNARTVPDGASIPGRDLPPVVASLSPSTVLIQPGGPAWSPLGASSGDCYAAGCGYTGWISSSFTVPESGSYQLPCGPGRSAHAALPHRAGKGPNSRTGFPQRPLAIQWA